MTEKRQRMISTYYSDVEPGRYAEVWMDFKEEVAFIKYLSDNDIQYFEEDFPGKSMTYVESAAENWALGHKKLEGKGIQLALF